MYGKRVFKRLHRVFRSEQFGVGNGERQVQEKRVVFILANKAERIFRQQIMRIGLAVEFNFLFIAPKVAGRERVGLALA